MSRNSKKVKNTELNSDNLRNALIFYSPMKPNQTKLYIKLFAILFFPALYIAWCAYTSLLSAIVITLGIILVLYIAGYAGYMVYYYMYSMNIFDERDVGVVVGFSNKILCLTGNEVTASYDTAKINVRALKKDEQNPQHYNYKSSILEGVDEQNKVLCRVYVTGIKEYEGMTLLPDTNRINEDLTVEGTQVVDDIEFTLEYEEEPIGDSCGDEVDTPSAEIENPSGELDCKEQQCHLETEEQVGNSEGNLEK